jgi:poly-gamma-glutamate capsule biosynthesis protein CapA/YwtB (metallophosphatase superfamily)
MSNTDTQRRLYSRAKKILRVFRISLITFFITFITVFAILWFSSGGKNNSYEDFRAEGLSFKEALPSGVKYIRKYFQKKISAPDSIVQFFKIQHEYLEFIKVSDGALKTGEEESDDVTVDAIGYKNLDRELLLNNKEVSDNDEIVLSMAFVGDIMWMRKIRDDFPDEELRQYLSKFDMVFGNLETPIDTLQKVRAFWPDYAKYNSSPKLLRSFKKDDGSNIFTALSLANNHALDMGVDGLRRTMDFLRGEGIRYTGATIPGGNDSNGHEGNFIVIEKNGVRIGFYATSWGLNEPSALKKGNVRINYIPGLAPLQKEKIDLSEPIRALKQMEREGLDFKIIYIHWGFEFEMYPDTEIMRVGRDLAAAGADFIGGTHPHVVQPSEIVLGNGYRFLEEHKQKDVAALFENLDEKRIFYHFKDSTGKPRKSLIHYSLGNFTTSMFTEQCRVKAIQSVQLRKNGDFIPHFFLYFCNRN